MIDPASSTCWAYRLRPGRRRRSLQFPCQGPGGFGLLSYRFWRRMSRLWVTFVQLPNMKRIGVKTRVKIKCVRCWSTVVFRIVFEVIFCKLWKDLWCWRHQWDFIHTFGHLMTKMSARSNHQFTSSFFSPFLEELPVLRIEQSSGQSTRMSIPRLFKSGPCALGTKRPYDKAAMKQFSQQLTNTNPIWSYEVIHPYDGPYGLMFPLSFRVNNRSIKHISFRPDLLFDQALVQSAAWQKTCCLTNMLNFRPPFQSPDTNMLLMFILLLGWLSNVTNDVRSLLLGVGCHQPVR